MFAILYVFALSCALCFLTYGVSIIVRKISFLRDKAIFVSVALVGILWGLATVISATFSEEYLAVAVNFPAVILGRAAYGWSVGIIIGNNSPEAARHSIPWFLRLPQVYLYASAFPGACLGLVAQTAYDWAWLRKPARIGPLARPIAVLLLTLLIATEVAYLFVGT